MLPEHKALPQLVQNVLSFLQVVVLDHMKGTVYQPRVLQLNLENRNQLPHNKNCDRRIREFASKGMEQDTQATTPPVAADILQ